ncbi:MAG: thioesterase family protein [Bacteroidaceae bacterium]|nr:thioesterase family protein [Bacteroidaceae bacterium]MEA5099246.1 thioesterase family protein [Bacteroidales bacterium]NCC18117.1 dihydrolipoamide acyltransferase [Bacteroidia bacterium]
MEINIPQRQKGEKEVLVNETNTAKAYGSGLIDVFATPAMIALMENTAHSSIQEFLPQGMVTVGIEINVKHIKATPIGKTVKCNSYLEKVDGKRLYFTIEAFDQEGKIGEANHIRYIVDALKFVEKLK